MLRRATAFVLATAFMVTLGSVSHSLFVQHAWSTAAAMATGSSSVTIPLRDRVSWAAHDVTGMIVPYGSLSAIALLIAFLAAGLLARLTGRRTLVFGLAGAFAIFVLFAVLRGFLGTVGVFGARGAGLSGQMLAGLLAGVLFAHLTAPRTAKSQPSRHRPVWRGT